MILTMAIYIFIGLWQLLAIWLYQIERKLELFEAIFIVLLWPYLWLITFGLTPPNELINNITQNAKTYQRQTVYLILAMASIGIILYAILLTNR